MQVSLEAEAQGRGAQGAGTILSSPGSGRPAAAAVELGPGRHPTLSPVSFPV